MTDTNGEPFAQLRETHTGLVLLCGERAYKVKKPVVTDFLDFGSIAARERACLREIELNRRLAPDVYLGLAHLTDPGGGAGEPVVVMRRMPEAARLSTGLDRGTVTHAELAELAALIADFHRAARRGPEIDRAGVPAALRHRWDVLLHSLREQPRDAVDPAVVDRIARLVGRYLDGRGPLLARRIAAGRIVDGHGDLLVEDIFALPDGFRVLDCLDFDDQLRYVDCLDDAAFLAMDLEFRGHPALATRFLDDYLHAADDTPPASLRHHYIAYRAMVRAKTDRIRADQGVAAAAERATRHLDLAAAHLSAGAVRLTLVGGLPGTGKSTIAQALAAETGAELLSSDSVRAELRAVGAVVGTGGTFGAGAYRPEAKARVYAELLDRARARLEQGDSVILDASWSDAESRTRAAQLADHTVADLVELRCACPPDIAAERMFTRDPGDSEATPEIAKALSATASPWPAAVTLDTTAPVGATVDTALRAWQGTG
ncbi:MULTISPECIES: AAA family ATPase [unclassified Nocardia]|uniref:bifunctional aminoglycoside phosphotransferase/ATP-binding protein n=1 Tax=unclassified Nocardia TaxID=2637762 RepID=UPI0024A8C206|nr:MULTISPECIES: AAA family ATPase [unclassified Nocardia]